MTLKEASRQFCISMDRLKSYEENGLILCERLVDGIPDYTEEELGKAGLIHSLLESGMEMEVLQKFMCLLREKAESREEQVRILRRQRYRLLDEIHGKQQLLDELDYMISEKKKGGITK